MKFSHRYGAPLKNKWLVDGKSPGNYKFAGCLRCPMTHKFCEDDTRQAMSDSWINIIPNDPKFVPNSQAQQQAVDFMRRIVGKADEVTCELSENVRFIDCGENLERILCPKCRREISCEWWRDQMEYQFEHGFTLDPVQLPCCGAAVSLAELTYEWPQGYAKFSVEAMNPEIADLTSEQVLEFETILGCRVIKILQHI